MVRTNEIDLSPNGGTIRRLPLLANAAPVVGALLSWDSSGYAHALVAGEPFAGICTRSVRRGGYSSNGDGQVEAMTGLFDMSSAAAISGIDITDAAAGTAIYASDDSTLTETSTSNTRIGCVAGLDGARVVIAAITRDVAAAVADGVGISSATAQALIDAAVPGQGNPLTYTEVALTDAATIATNAALGTDFAVTINASRTMGAPTNPANGRRITYAITQGTGGSRLITWATGAGGFAFGDDVVEPVLSTTVGKTDYVTFQYNLAAARWRCLAYARGY